MSQKILMSSIYTDFEVAELDTNSRRFITWWR